MESLVLAQPPLTNHLRVSNLDTHLFRARLPLVATLKIARLMIYLRVDFVQPVLRLHTPSSYQFLPPLSLITFNEGILRDLDSNEITCIRLQRLMVVDVSHRRRDRPVAKVSLNFVRWCTGSDSQTGCAVSA